MLSRLTQLYKEETAQASTEYILVLSIVVGLLMILLNKLIKPTYAKLLTTLSRQIQAQLSSANLHSFRIPR